MCGADIEQTIKDLMPEGPHDHYIGKLISMLVYLGVVNWSSTSVFNKYSIQDWAEIKEQSIKCIDAYIDWRYS